MDNEYKKILFSLSETAELFWGDGSRPNQKKVKKMIEEGGIEGTKIGRRIYVPINQIEKFKEKLS